jgi:hypothetical protein
VGSDCEVIPCSGVLDGISLSALLFHADLQLRRYSATFNATVEQPKDAFNYLKDLVEVQIDVKGDGLVSRDEVLNTLAVRSVHSANLSSLLYLWCGHVNSASTDCVWDELTTADLINQAYANFMTSPKHTFDGSGSFAVSNMQSTYPNPDWTDEECESYDSFQTPDTYNRVTTTWDLAFTDAYTLRQVCGFVNGLASEEFTTSELLKGEATSFQDFVPVSSDFGFKRVYCLSLFYAHSGSAEMIHRFECSVGLFFASNLSVFTR